MDQPRAAARLIAARLKPPGESVRIAGEEAAHARARRLCPGDSVVLIDGSGREAGGRIERFAKAALDVAVLWVRAAPEQGQAATLFVCGVRPERLDWIAEKATELGAARLVLVASERSQAFRASPSRAARLARVVREAAKQCESARWPEVSGPVELAGALSEPFAHRFFLDFDAAPFPASLPPAAAALLVGPEGGWSVSERAQARASGWTPVSLPAGKLRAETAALAGLVLLRAAFVSAPV
ncbi:MAG: RsmE family RNA methyltransferase [Thermoanaerobaculia bacterium]